jgi:hypothetical protein
MAQTHSPSLPGGDRYLKESGSTVNYYAVAQDQEEEIEGIVSSAISDPVDLPNSHYFSTPISQDAREKPTPEQLSRQLKKASENVVVAGTLEEYNRYLSLVKFNFDLISLQTLEAIQRVLLRNWICGFA